MFLRLSILALLGPIAAASSEPPSAYVERIDAVPDLTQTRVRDSALRDGQDFCAPVAVSNSLVYLARNGYPKLLDNGPANESAQIALIRRLASPEFMRTSADGGTSKEGVVDGVGSYVTRRGYTIEHLSYRGIEVYYQPEEPAPSESVALPWLKARLAAGASIWLQIGWYHDEDQDFRKTGGHWVTLVGYGVDEAGELDEACLVLHDPSPRAGLEFANEFARAERLESGRILGWGLPQPAQGFYRLSDGMHLPEDADTAIIEGTVVLELASP